MTVRITVAIIFLAFSVAACATDNKNPPNIVLIISDYMGYHDIQPYGATDIQTPSLSRLAAEGVTMTDFHAAAPVCGPSRAALPPYQPPGLSESQWDEGWDVDTATRQDYVQMVERMDEGIGQVLDKLDTLGIDENTLVIYLYDHGGRNLVNSEPLFHGFGTLWEGGIRIPAIMRLPGVIPENRKSAMAGIAMDLTATIVDVAGIKNVASSLDGISLMPFLRGEQPPISRQFYWRADSSGFGKQRAIRDGKWKYIEHGYTQFLFDLNADVSERHNLFYKELDVASRLRTDLASWLESFPVD